MTGYAVKTYRLADDDVSVWMPRTPRSGYGVVLAHGAGAPTQFMNLAAQAASVRLAAAIASAGIACIAGPFGGDAWGNDTALTAMDAARIDLVNHVPGLDTTKVLLLGVSMGGGAVARYSIENPALVAGVIGVIPAFNYAYEWANVPAVRASLGAAWGVTYPAALPADADNLANAAAAAGIPLLAAYSTADTTVPAAGVEAYTAAVGGTNLVISTTLNHSDALVGLFDAGEAIRFLVANGA